MIHSLRNPGWSRAKERAKDRRNEKKENTPREETVLLRFRGGRLPAFFEVRLGFGERVSPRDSTSTESEYGSVSRCADQVDLVGMAYSKTI